MNILFQIIDRMLRKKIFKSYYSEDRTPDDDPTSFSYTPFGMISKKHGVKFYSDQSIPIEQYALGVSDIVNSDHIIAASRMRSDVVIFVSSLEDVDTICSHGLSVNGRFFEAQCLVNIPKKLTL